MLLFPGDALGFSHTKNIDRLWIWLLLIYKLMPTYLQGLVPRLHAARAVDDNLLRLFWYCYRPWRDRAVACRLEPIEISSRCKELGLPNPCPFTLPISDELTVHQKDLADFVTAQKLKKMLICLLDTTPHGWVPTQSWEATESAHKEAFDECIQAVRDARMADHQSMSEEELGRFGLLIWSDCCTRSLLDIPILSADRQWNRKSVT